MLRKKRAWIEAGEAKGRKGISVPLPATAIAALRDSGPNREGLVFALHGRAMLSPNTGWHAAVKRAGIALVRWHDLRHTWATWHVHNGASLAVLRELGGWASLDQVQIFATRLRQP